MAKRCRLYTLAVLKGERINDMSDTKIEWADKVWNPVVGCTKCSPGCLNCYAERMAKRLYWMGMAEPSKLPEYMKFKDGWKKGHIECCEHRLNQPLDWRKPKRIFVCSMSDLFHPKVPFEFICKVMDFTQKCPQHTFLILTKRPESAKLFYGGTSGMGLSAPPLHNVHLGVSISNQTEADEKIPILLQIPAAVRWLSIEPMLGPVDLKFHLGLAKNHEDLRGLIGWVVVGCESGPGRRPCNTEWVRSIVAQCKAASVPVFVKQVNVQGKVIKMPQAWPQKLPERR